MSKPRIILLGLLVGFLLFTSSPVSLETSAAAPSETQLLAPPITDLSSNPGSPSSVGTPGDPMRSMPDVPLADLSWQQISAGVTGSYRADYFNGDGCWVQAPNCGSSSVFQESWSGAMIAKDWGFSGEKPPGVTQSTWVARFQGVLVFPPGCYTINGMRFGALAVYLSRDTSFSSDEAVIGKVGTGSDDAFFVSSPMYLSGTYHILAVYLESGDDRSRLYMWPFDATGCPSATSTPVPPTATPTDLVAQADSPTAMNIGWQDNSNNEDGFRVYRQKASGGTWAQVKQLGADTDTWRDTGLECGTSYRYYVVAYNSAGESGWSNVATANTLGCVTPTNTPTGPSVPAAPTDLVAQADSPTTMNVGWTDNANNEVGFWVYRRKVGGAWHQVKHSGTNTESWRDTGLECGTTYEYYVVAYNDVGTSGQSNVATANTQNCAAPTPTVQLPIPVDLDFRPNPNGYKFANVSQGSSYWSIRFGDQEMRDLYGEACVCVDSGEDCELRLLATALRQVLRNELGSGVCLGMSVTALRFYNHEDNVAEFGASSTYGVNHLLDWKAMRNLAKFQIASNSGQGRWRSVYPLRAFADALLASSPTNPLVLGFYQQGGGGDHAVVPYRLAEITPGVWALYVYDPNRPGQEMYFTINVASGMWSYNNGTSYSGNESSGNLAYVHMFDYTPRLACPASLAGAQAGAPLEVHLGGAGHLLISDALGHQTGHTGNSFVNDIPDAEMRFLMANGGAEIEPIYTLPGLGDYTILLNGEAVTTTQAVTVTQFGASYGLVVENTELRPGDQEELVLSSAGDRIVLNPGSSKQTDLVFIRESVDESRQIGIRQIRVRELESLECYDDLDTGRLALLYLQSGPGEYDIELSKLDATHGMREFFCSGVDVSAGATHYLRYGTWDGMGLILEVDEDSDGEIDESRVLENELQTPLFLTMVFGGVEWTRDIVYASSTQDMVYRVSASEFRAYDGHSASDSSLRHISSPPAPSGWNQPDFVPDVSWRPAAAVWFDAWSLAPWSPIPSGCQPIGLLGRGGEPEGVDGTTYLFQRTFALAPPSPGMTITRAVLEMWSDNKSEWWWQGQSIAYDKETYIGQVNLYPGHIDADGGSYSLAVQNSNDTMHGINPQGITYRLQVTWSRGAH